MALEVQTLVNPVVMQIPEVAAELQNWSMFSAHHQELATRMSVGGAAVIVGTSDPMGLEGAAVVVLPGNFTEDAPWVVHFHNRGPRALTHKMVESVLDFIKVAGYNTFKALNQSGRPDAIWLRAFKQAGKPVFIGSAYFFDLAARGKDVRSNSTDRRGVGYRAESRPVRRERRRRAKQLVKSKPANRNNDADKRNDAVVPAARANRRRAAR